MKNEVKIIESGMRSVVHNNNRQLEAGNCVDDAAKRGDMDTAEVLKLKAEKMQLNMEEMQFSLQNDDALVSGGRKLAGTCSVIDTTVLSG